ncbi:sensory neuron membrane protein 1-like [Contarinia nasturtii]|uniref:sensory neuron membrane protein 1-like n=1 Tax=Contarinia nasturtii TaxID=265458 RepID=UPI0012D489B5|nr:sensory neuron membrane protein 1-like [Contarinia nasturtii]
MYTLQQMPINPKTISRRMYTKLPFPLEFHIHIFDLQNPEEVQNGGKPHFKDIGPYVFHEYLLKHDTIDDEENDTLQFTMRKTWIFKPKLSKGLTGEEIITTVHPVLNSLALAVNVDRKALLPMISDVIQIMFEPTSPFWTGRAMDLLFDGIPIDCSSNNFKVKAICSVFETGDNPSIQPLTDDGSQFKFSLFGAFNHSSNGVFKVSRGKKIMSDVGRVLEVDGNLEVDAWYSDEENQFKGTDGYFIPPFRSIDDEIWAFERALCISLNLQYKQKTYNRGAPLRTFGQNLDRFATNEAYCRENGSCPIPGTLDLFNCIGVPIIATLPHFLDTHPSLLEHVQSGLKPNRKDHEIFASIDLKTGIPLLGAKRLQLNFEMVPIPLVDVMKNLTSMIFPFIWIEERFKLPGIYVALLHLTLISSQRLVKIIEWLCFTLIPIAGFASLTIHYLIKLGQITVIDDSAKSMGRNAVIDGAIKMVNKRNHISHG